MLTSIPAGTLNVFSQIYSLICWYNMNANTVTYKK